MKISAKFLIISLSLIVLSSYCTVGDETLNPMPSEVSNEAADQMIPVIWDDDGSPDGVIALMYLMAHPNIEVKALTVSLGEAYPSVFAERLQQAEKSRYCHGRPPVHTGGYDRKIRWIPKSARTDADHRRLYHHCQGGQPGYRGRGTGLCSRC